jgi:hypothetical protein
MEHIFLCWDELDDLVHTARHLIASKIVNVLTARRYPAPRGDVRVYNPRALRESVTAAVSK